MTLTDPRIYSKRKGAERPPRDAVLVDRTTKWGNPFTMTNERERDQVCDDYEDWAEQMVAVSPTFFEPLRGKDLLCWCVPKRCHAETILRLANRE